MMRVGTQILPMRFVETFERLPISKELELQPTDIAIRQVFCKVKFKGLVLSHLAIKSPSFLWQWYEYFW